MACWRKVNNDWGKSRGTPMILCVSYPVDVCYVIIYTKKNRVNQNIKMLLISPFFCQLLRLLFSPDQNQWANKVYFTFLKTAVISSPNSSFCQFFSSLILLMSLLSSGLWMARVFIVALVNTSEGFISRALAL